MPSPRHYQKSLRKLRHLNKELARRQGLNKKTGEMPSRRWEKTHTKLRAQHNHIKNQRSDFLNKATKHLIDNYETIVIENLNIKGMAKNRHLSQHIMTSNWGEFARQLEYKATRYDSTIVTADRFYPSSKTCSHCGVIKATLPLKERTFHCNTCNHISDRDINAANNLKQLVAQSRGETQNGHGGSSAGLRATVNETAAKELSSTSSH